MTGARRKWLRLGNEMCSALLRFGSRCGGNMQFIHGPQLSKAIRSIVGEGEADLAVAFWGGSAIDLLGFPADCSRYRISCDAHSGACHPETLKNLIARGARLVDVPGVHAKVYLGASSVVVGSANASSNGLAEDLDVEAFGLEAGVTTRDRATVDNARRWISGTFRKGRPLTLDDLPEIERIWNLRRSNVPARRDSGRLDTSANAMDLSLAQMILTAPEKTFGRNARVFIYSADHTPSKAEEDYRASDAFDQELWDAAGDEYPFFWGDGPELRAGDVVLCFEMSPRRARYALSWRVGQKFMGREHQITPCDLVHRPLGLTPGNMLAVALRLPEMIGASLVDKDGPPLELSAFAEKVFNFGQMKLQQMEQEISDEGTRVAHHYLLAQFSSLHMTISHKSGKGRAICVRDAVEDYVFSWMPASAHLLFYIRWPALKRFIGLGARTIEIFPDAEFVRNQMKFKIRTHSEAKRLLDWLVKEYPLLMDGVADF